MRVQTFYILVTALLLSSASYADRSVKEHVGKDKVSLSVSLKSPDKNLSIEGQVQIPRYLRLTHSKMVFGKYYAIVTFDNSIECHYAAKRQSLSKYLAHNHKLYFQSCSDGDGQRKVRSVEESISLSLSGKTYFGRSNVVVQANFLVEDAVSEKEGITLEGVSAVEGQVLQFDGDLWVAADIDSVQGEKGDTGIQGIAGENGLNGVDGEQGAQGEVGPQGIAGINGTSGSQGLKGEKGNNGESGTQGIQGLQGVAGIDGAAGVQGSKGNAGPQGIQGIAGINGVAGSQGLKGDIGLQGIAGTNGVAGAQGLKGDIGPQGVAGLSGASGSQGIQGAKGDAGSQGAQGVAGLNGSNGTNGADGVQGLQGEKGDNGKDANVNLSAGIGIKGSIVNGEGEISVDVGTEPGQLAQVGVDGRLPASLMPEGVGSSKVAFAKDLKPSGTHGGDCTAGTYVKRDLNSLSGDSSFISINNNQIFLSPGTYRVDASAPGFLENVHKAKFVNITSGQTLLVGTTERSHTQYGNVSYSKIMGEFTISEASSFEVQHRCTTSRTTVGFGMAAAFGEDEVYTQVKIEKVK